MCICRPELFRFDESQSVPEDAFLRNLIDRTSGSQASKLVKVMRTSVREDQGSVEEINRAVYAGCAVLLKCSGLVKEAMAVAAGTTKVPSPALVKAWRAAQKMRSFFDLTELRIALAASLPPAPEDSNGSTKAGASTASAVTSSAAAASAPAVPTLARQASLGSDNEVYRIASSAIVERALFLLRSPASALTQISAEDLLDDADGGAVDGDAALGDAENTGSLSPLPGSPKTIHPYALLPLSTNEGSPGPPHLHLQLGPPVDPSSPSMSMLSSPSSALDMTPLGGGGGGGSGTAGADYSTKSGALSAVSSNRKPPLMRQLSNDTKNVSNLWYSLVGEASLFSKLKNMLAERKRMAVRATATNRKGSQSMSEKVLHFLQSDVNIARLEEVNSLRNKRAILRSKGFDILADLLTSASHPFALHLAATAFGSTLQELRREDTALPAKHVHFMNAVEGCSPEQSGLVWEKFSRLLRCNVIALRRCREQILSAQTNSSAGAAATVVVPVGPTDGSSDNSAGDAASWERAAISCLCSCALDFETSDQSLVNDSGLLPELQALMGLGIPRIREAAEGLFEGLVDRCMKVSAGEASSSKNATSITSTSGPSGGGVAGSSGDSCGEEPTELCRSLVDMMLQRIVSAAQAVAPKDTPPTPLPTLPRDADALLSSAVPIVPGTIASHQYEAGYSYPQYALRSAISSTPGAPGSATGGITYSLWIKRPRSALLDACDDTAGSEGGTPSSASSAQPSIEKINIGMKVMPGPEFQHTGALIGGGLDTLGTVTKVLINENALMVQWPSEKTLKYSYKESLYQVVLADDQVGGHVFCVGTPNLLGSPPVSSVGVVLLPNATLCAFSSGGDGSSTANGSSGGSTSGVAALSYLQSAAKLAPDEWVHVALQVPSADGDLVRLYIQGELCGSCAFHTQQAAATTTAAVTDTAVVAAFERENRETYAASSHPLVASDLNNPVLISFPGASRIHLRFKPWVTSLPTSALFVFTNFTGTGDYESACDDVEDAAARGLRCVKKTLAEFPFAWEGDKVYVKLLAPGFDEVSMRKICLKFLLFHFYIIHLFFKSFFLLFVCCNFFLDRRILWVQAFRHRRARSCSSPSLSPSNYSQHLKYDVDHADVHRAVAVLPPSPLQCHPRTGHCSVTGATGAAAVFHARIRSQRTPLRSVRLPGDPVSGTGHRGGETHRGHRTELTPEPVGRRAAAEHPGGCAQGAGQPEQPPRQFYPTVLCRSGTVGGDILGVEARHRAAEVLHVPCLRCHFPSD